MAEKDDPADIEFDLEIRPSIPELRIPEFKPHISPDEVATFTQRDQRLLLAFSVAAQQLEFMLACLKEGNQQMRKMEAENIKLRVVVSDLRKWKQSFKRRWIFALSLIVTALTGAASALGSWLVQYFSTPSTPPLP